MKQLKYLVFLLGLNSLSAFSQPTNQLILLNKKGKIIYQLTEGNRVRIVPIENYIGSPKYKGTLKIINDSIIAVNGKSLHIDSIYKMGKLKKENQIVGHSITVLGSGIIGSGIGMLISSYNNSSIMVGILGLIGGTVSMFIGTATIIIGEKIANGSPRRVSQNRKIKVQKSSLEEITP